MNFEQQVLLGCLPEVKIPEDIRPTMINVDKDMTAREFVQIYTAPEACEELAAPQQCKEKAPETPSAYTDGSMLNPRSLHCRIGGLGVWWPGRQADITKEETAYTQRENTGGGKMVWVVFENLKNISTRSEIATTLVGMPPHGR